ncbi:MAG: glycosyl transferase family 1 [Gemmatimonadetes bacterium]|nr:MAG: glycosyl transferase family 1 [Gemmatimonadota bacterium]PYO71930.1 MAG: glycosyl transferase family 1 [Gemmatimonadota bacterium]TLY46641.1 MAG: glycosyltransferase family 4 protein [Gemmatimonadota bacterium]
MKILFLCEGDAETWTCWSGSSKSLVEHLRADGHDVTCGNVDLRGVDRLAGAAATFSPRRKRWTARFHLGAVPFRLRSRNAAVHIAAHSRRVDVILQGGATYELRNRGTTPYFVCCDSNIHMSMHGVAAGYRDAAPLSRRALAAVARRELAVYRDAAGIFTLSDRVRRSFIDDFGLPEDRVHTILAGPNFPEDRTPPIGRPRAAAHTPTILFVGRQFERKGGDLLLRAFRSVRQRIPHTRLLIAGPRRLPDLEPGVTFLGDLDKNQPGGWNALVAAYKGADVFCLPTRFEPFGIAFIEAMYFGLPCVGTDAWAVPEMVVDGETGFTVPVDDLEGLTDRLVRLLGDPALAARMGQAGRARAEHLFTWRMTVQRMMDAMRPIVRRASAAAT